jgi:hypothetical protein
MARMTEQEMNDFADILAEKSIQTNNGKTERT